MRIQDLYINSKNVCTLGIYMYNGQYGLEINGARIQFGTYNSLCGESEERLEEILKELRGYQQTIIDEIEKK